MVSHRKVKNFKTLCSITVELETAYKGSSILFVLQLPLFLFVCTG